MVHLLHESISIRTQIAAARRLNTYTVAHGHSDGPPDLSVAFDLVDRVMTEAILEVTEWLKSQVIGLHGWSPDDELLGDPPPAHRSDLT